MEFINEAYFSTCKITENSSNYKIGSDFLALRCFVARKKGDN